MQTKITPAPDTLPTIKPMLCLGRAGDDLICSIVMSPFVDVVLPSVVVGELVSCSVFDSKESVVNVWVMRLDV